MQIFSASGKSPLTVFFLSKMTAKESFFSLDTQKILCDDKHLDEE